MPRATRVRMSMSGSSNHHAPAEASTAVRTKVSTGVRNRFGAAGGCSTASWWSSAHDG
jgi:hypothetical protein